MRAAKKVLDVPAIKLPGGKVIKGKRGDTHLDIMDRLKKKPDGNIQHGFMDKDGDFHTRMQARHKIRDEVGASLGSGRPTSVDLMAKKKPKTKKGKQAKMQKVMREFKMGGLRSGSKKGPKVKSRKQAIAIGLKQSGQSKYNGAKRVGKALS